MGVMKKKDYEEAIEPLQLELAPGTAVRVARQAVVRVITPEDRIDERPEGTGSGE